MKETEEKQQRKKADSIVVVIKEAWGINIYKCSVSRE
jgi:hypothetical protein